MNDPFNVLGGAPLSKEQEEANRVLHSNPTWRAYEATVKRMCQQVKVPSEFFFGSAMLADNDDDEGLEEERDEFLEKGEVGKSQDLCSPQDLKEINCCCPHVQEMVQLGGSSSGGHASVSVLSPYESILRNCEGTCVVCQQEEGGGGGIDRTSQQQQEELNLDDLHLHSHCIGCLSSQDLGAFCPRHMKEHCMAHEALAKNMMDLLDAQDGGDEEEEPPAAGEAEGDGETTAVVSDKAVKEHFSHCLVVSSCAGPGKKSTTHSNAWSQAATAGASSQPSPLAPEIEEVVFCYQCKQFAPLTRILRVGKEEEEEEQEASSQQPTKKRETENARTIPVDQLRCQANTVTIMNKLLLAMHLIQSMMKKQPQSQRLLQKHRDPSNKAPEAQGGGQNDAWNSAATLSSRYDGKSIFLYRPTLFRDDDEDALNDELEDNLYETCTDAALLLFSQGRGGEGSGGEKMKQQEKHKYRTVFAVQEGKKVQLLCGPEATSGLEGGDAQVPASPAAPTVSAAINGFLLVFPTADVAQEKCSFLRSHGYTVQPEEDQQLVYLTNEQMWCKAYVPCFRKEGGEEAAEREETAQTNETGARPSSSALQVLPASLSGKQLVALFQQLQKENEAGFDRTSFEEIEFFSDEFVQMNIPPHPSMGAEEEEEETPVATTTPHSNGTGGAADGTTHSNGNNGTDLLASAVTSRDHFNFGLAAAAGCSHSQAADLMRFLGGMTMMAHVMSVAPALVNAAEKEEKKEGADSKSSVAGEK